MKKIFLAIIIVLALITLGASVYTVNYNDAGIVKQFGKAVRVETNAGLHFKIPFIQDVQAIYVGNRIYDIPQSDVITRDKKSMIADDYILWRVEDAKKFTQTLNASVTAAEDRVSVAVYNATKNTISAMSQDELIEARGEKLTSLITEESNSDLGSYGITIEKAELPSCTIAIGVVICGGT